MNSKHEGNKPAETPGVQYVRIGSTNNPQQQQHHLSLQKVSSFGNGCHYRCRVFVAIVGTRRRDSFEDSG